jgi:hypothetical protein
MSFSITMQAFENGTFATFKRSIAWEIFGPFAQPSPAGGYVFFKNGKRGGEFDIDDEEEITGVGIDRPSDAALRCLYDLACKVPSLIEWMGFTGTAVTDAAFIAGQPSWFDKLDRPPSVVHSFDELLRCIQTS